MKTLKSTKCLKEFSLMFNPIDYDRLILKN